jgi:hypothetical protein
MLSIEGRAPRVVRDLGKILNLTRFRWHRQQCEPQRGKRPRISLNPVRQQTARERL